MRRFARNVLFALGRRGIEDTPEAKLLEARARNDEAVILARAALAGQRDLEEDDRDLELVNLCLDLLSALSPTPVDAYTIHELPQLARLRPGAPAVVPGRTS